MKRNIFIFCFFIIILQVSFSEQNRPVAVGIHLAAGGRYDDVRMCVASGSGVKGGTMVDLYFDILIPSGDKGTFIINIPVMRPILFAAAFNMLQFEPQVSYEYQLGAVDETSVVIGAGLGIVFHYGPDYTSSAANPGDSFFAMGPLVSAFAGVQIPGSREKWMPGIKAFYSPLFSPDYKTGQVLGGAAEVHYRF